MMKTAKPRLVCHAVVISLAVGCSPPTYVDLTYQHGTYVRKVSPALVGVYYPEDLRPGWPPTAAARTFDGKHGKDAGMQQSVGNKDINVFVAESLRAELAATGLKVSGCAEFNRLGKNATADGARTAGVERVVLGRINYFGFVGPVPPSTGTGILVGGVMLGVVGAIAGAAIVRGQDEVRGGKAFVDIDLWVVDANTGKVLWAGTARGKHNSKISMGSVGDRVAVFLSDALRDAFRAAFWRPDFVAAMGATMLPVAAKDAQAQVYEQKGKTLFQAERFAEAAVEFQNAYQTNGDPTLLFNMALSLRKAGNAKLALATYEDYLRKVPDSPQRPAVEARIKELKQQLAAPNPSGM